MYASTAKMDKEPTWAGHVGISLGNRVVIFLSVGHYRVCEDPLYLPELVDLRAHGGALPGLASIQPRAYRACKESRSIRQNQCRRYAASTKINYGQCFDRSDP